MGSDVRHEGRCSCGELRFRMNAEPLVVHACHCRQCQRVTGSAFVLNALIEKKQLELLSGEPSRFHFPDTWHTAYFCPSCATYVWSEYKSGRFDDCRFVRVGTLDAPDDLPPSVHIYTESKQPWVLIPEQSPRYEAFYPIAEVWPKCSIRRMGSDWDPCQHLG